MDRAYIDANHVVDRYVQGKLDGTELEEFEIYMLEHPQIVRDIEFAKGMRDSISAAGTELFSGDHATAGQSMSGLPYALAASFLLALSLSFSAYQYFEIQDLKGELLESGGPIPLGREYYLEPVRGESDTAIEQDTQRATLIRADVGGADAESWSVELRSEGADLVWQEHGLKADGHLVSILLGVVPAGRYTLTVLAEPGGALSATYALQIKASAK